MLSGAIIHDDEDVVTLPTSIRHLNAFTECRHSNNIYTRTHRMNIHIAHIREHITQTNTRSFTLNKPETWIQANKTPVVSMKTEFSSVQVQALTLGPSIDVCRWVDILRLGESSQYVSFTFTFV